MDKTNIVNTFTELVDQLRNTECSQKEKIICFQRISECIISPTMAAHVNYANFCTKAVNILLLFCEDLDSVVRTSAEENLNKIFRVLEKSRVNRILMDLYGEIKRNGNQRSLRICLRIFGYYAPQIREHGVRWYAQNLFPCMKVISRRKETLLQETLSEFVAKFGKHIQQGLTDSETCKLFEAFIENIGSDCAVKRRCTAQNCINLIEHACNKVLMAKYALNKVIEILLTDHQTNTILGTLGFLRQLVVIVIKGFTLDSNDNEDSYSNYKSNKSNNIEESRQLLEIYDYCLYLVSSMPTTQHSTINAALEVINSILQSLDGLSSRDAKKSHHIGPKLLQIINDKSLKHANYLRSKNTLKHQIFNLEFFDEVDRSVDLIVRSQDIPESQTSSDIVLLQPEQQHQQQQHSKTTLTTTSAADAPSSMKQHQMKRYTARSISECVDIDYVDEDVPPQLDNQDGGGGDVDDDDGDFTTLSEMNDSQHTPHASVLGNIDFTAKTSSSVINETISGHVGDAAGGLKMKDDDVHAAAAGGNTQKFLVNFSSDDEKSIQLCNTDNESVNSIEFKAELSRGLFVEGIHSNSASAGDVRHGAATEENAARNAATGDGSSMATITTTTTGKSSNDAFTTFFNNFNAASESVTKLFRPASSSSSSKNVVSPTNTADSISLASNVSSLKRVDTEVEVIEDSSPDSSKTFPTPSTAIMGEIRSLDSVDIQSGTDVKQTESYESKETPKRFSKNPFLNSTSPFGENSDIVLPLLPVDIGSIYEQTLLYYTARLIAARFLLTGRQKGLYDDTAARVSIKSICLNVISQCTRLRPEILEISLKFLETEKPQQQIVEESPVASDRHSPLPIPSDSSSNIGQDYEHLDVTGGTVDITEVPRKLSFTHLDVFRIDDNTEGPLLEIIDDHFGKSTNDFNFTSTMTRSADPVLISKADETAKSSPIMKTKRDKLSTSEIIGIDTKLRGFVEITKAEEDMPPDMAPPRPPKRTKTFRKSKAEMEARKKEEYFEATLENEIQYLRDILYFYNHEDPILRAGIQIIIGQYCRSNQAGLVGESKINLQYLLAILCVGLQDDIHTVVIQALNTFDKIFPYVLFKYMTTPKPPTATTPNKASSTHQQQTCHGRQHKEPTHNKEQQQQEQKYCSKEDHPTDTSSHSAPTTRRATRTTNLNCISGHFNDNDGIIAALLNAFQLPAKINNSINSDSQAMPTDPDPNNHIMNVDGIFGAGGGNAASSSSFAHCCAATSSSQHYVYAKLRCNCTASASVSASASTSTTSESCCCHCSSYCCGNILFISPKLLLNKLRLCHYNKYWLVQNKYAEVISNLNYASLRSYYGNNYTSNNNISNIPGNCCRCTSSTSSNGCRLCCCNGGMMGWYEDDVDGTDFVCFLENSFIDELLQLVAEDDVRVRESASKCLCRFILQNAKHSNSHHRHQSRQQRNSFAVRGDDENVLHRRTYCDNMKMLQNFLEYSIFCDMSPALRYLLNPQYQQRQQGDQDILASFDNMLTATSSSCDVTSPGVDAIQAVLSKVLYRLTNKVMSFKDKNVQFGIIYCIKQLLKYFPFADYSCSWSEFNFMEIFVKLSQYNYNTAVDLTCQSDLIDVSSKLIVGSSIFEPDVEQQNRENTMSLFKHTMKIINIYYHIFTNQKPLIMAKTRVEIFGNAKELATAQSLGYFGNEYIYLKLYQTLKSAYDNYKITINEEAGSKLISLLKTCLNSLSVCIEMLPHEAAINSGGAGSAAAAAAAGTGVVGNIGIAKSASDVNATTTSSSSSSSASGGGTAGGTGGAECITVLKLIEETLQYLTKVINYAPEESIACLRQLLKYLFARNYGNRQHQQHHKKQPTTKQGHYPTFINSYFKAKCKEQQCISNEEEDDDGCPGRSRVVGVGTSQKQTNNQPSSSSSSSYSRASSTSTTTANVTSTTIQLQSLRRLSAMDVGGGGGNNSGGGSGTGGTFSTVALQDDYLLLAELFASGLEYHTWKSQNETELAKHIKIFEPLVIYCLTLFLKCNGRIQSGILEMLCLLLEFNVTYSSLDSKNVIFDHITKSLDIIEGGIARNGLYIITPMIKFLIKLSSKNERSLITIPKIISIINNLLANNSIKDVAIQALKTLTYEIFLMTSTTTPSKKPMDTTPIHRRPADDPNSLAAITENLLTLNNELDTQKEVILGMLEKFIETNDCQQVLSLLLLIEQLRQLQQQQHTIANESANMVDNVVEPSDVTGGAAGSLEKQQQLNATKCLPNLDTACNMICQSICSNRLYIHDWNTYSMVDTFFKNNTKYLLGNSKEFMALLKYIIEGDVANFSDLSYATIILSNVILKTEEIYLVNHIKLYLKNHPTTVEKLKRKQQQRHDEQQQQQQQQHQRQQQKQTANHSNASQWLLDASNDKPSTSSAAKAAAAAAAAASSNSPTTSSSPSTSHRALSGVLNEYNYFPTVLCDVLLECLQTVADHRRNSDSWYSHQFTPHYCRLVCNFVKVLNKLCSNTRLEDFLLVSIRSILNGCESKLLNEYYNLLMMYSTQGCPTSCYASSSSATTSAAAALTTTTAASFASSSLLETDDDNVVLQLQLEMFQLLNSVGVLDTLALLQRLQSNDISNHVRRALLNKVCHHSVPPAMEWNLQQVQHLFNGKFLNILIVEQFAFLCNLCEVDEEFCSLFQATILANIKVLNKHSIIYLLRLVEYLCKKSEECSMLRFAKFLQILNKLHNSILLTTGTLRTAKLPSSPSLSWQSSLSSSMPSTMDRRPLQLQIERLARHLIVNSSDTYDKNAIYDTFVHLIEEDEEHVQLQLEQQHQSTSKEGIAASSSSTSSSHFNLSEHLQFMILNDLENCCETNDDDGTPLGSVSNIVDEKWTFNQLIKFSAQNNYDPEQIVKILLEIQSENKLQKIFNTANFDGTRILKHTISHSLQAMLQTFRNNCIQYNPHIHYMRPNPLARVSLSQLMTRIVEMEQQQQQRHSQSQHRPSGAGDAGGTGGGGGGVIGGDNKATVTKDPTTITSETAAGTTTTAAADDTGKVGHQEDGDDDGDNAVGDEEGRRHLYLSSTIIIHLCEAVIALMENIKQIEVTALIYIESKFIDKFLSEHLLRPEHVITLVRFVGHCCRHVLALCNNRPLLMQCHEQRNSVTVVLHCIDILLHQKFIWSSLNQQALVKATTAMSASGTRSAGATPAAVGGGGAVSSDACAPLTKCELNTIICSLLDVVSLAGTLLLENTLFYKKYKNALRSPTSSSSSTSSITTEQQQHQQKHLHPQYTHYDDYRHQWQLEHNVVQDESFENVAWLTGKYNPKAIFLGKLIETKIGNYDKGICFGGNSYNHSSSSTFCANSSCFASSSSSAGGASSIDIQDLKGINNQFDFISLNVLLSIGISTLRTNIFYATAVTPLEIMQQQQRLQACQSAQTSPSTSPSHKSQSGGGATTATSNSMLPIIPIESLSDVDILKSFVKRLSIFGFTTRQQFEEYFMTFLLLINKVYDENMVDQQEQFQIRSTCLEAIMELLITYKTFPIVGNKLSLYHHTTRWNRINCDTISLKKLHEIQLIISPANVFYHSNLERNLQTDSVIGTQYFGANQFDLNFMWQQMETNSSSQHTSIDESESSEEGITKSPLSFTASPPSKTKHLSGIAANTAYRNYQYFTRQSGVDYKSSSQLIFDVLMQMIEQNHILILPNLVKFTEICENREQIKQIWEKADYLKSHIPMDDTISHQYLIYLLCKTKGLLIPSHLEMLNLEALIKNYLKSSHLFIRCAALNGLLCLLESYAKTNTTIGKLSDELVRLKDVILSYIDKHGLIEESPLQCSDMHNKLIWTLNYSLMEWTSKLDPQCNVAYHTKMTVNKLLKKSNNEQLYLCILHGLERMIVLDNKVSSISSTPGGGGGVSGADSQNQMLRPSIEKLALELAKLENEKFSIPALKLLLSCIYVGSSKQLENTELSNGIVQDDPEIIAQQTDKVDILLQCIKTANEEAAWIYGQVLCQMIRDLVPPKEILTKVIKEFLAINQPHSDVIAMIVFQVFRSAIDSSFLQQLQDWLTCSLPTFLSLPEQKSVWSLSVVFLSASINLHLMKLFPLLLSGVKAQTAAVAATKAAAGAASATAAKRMSSTKLGQHEIALFVTSAQDFYAKLGNEQKLRFRDAFKEFHHIKVYNKMLQSL